MEWGNFLDEISIVVGILLILLILVISYPLVIFPSYTGKSIGGIIDKSAELTILDSKNNAGIYLYEKGDGNVVINNTGKTDLHNVRIKANGEPVVLFNAWGDIEPGSSPLNLFFDEENRHERELFRSEWKQGVAFQIIPELANIKNCPEMTNRNYSYITDDLTVDCKETYLLESDELKAKITMTIKRWHDHFRRDVLGCSDFLSYAFTCFK